MGNSSEGVRVDKGLDGAFANVEPRGTNRVAVSVIGKGLATNGGAAGEKSS